MKSIWTSLLILFSTSPMVAWATAAVDDSAYHKTLITLLMKAAFGLAALVSIIFFIMVSVNYFRQVMDKDSLSKRDLKPMSLVKFIAGIVLASALFTPMRTMSLFNDLTGVEGNGYKMCLALDVQLEQYKSWAPGVTKCLDKAKEQVTKVTKEPEGLDMAKLELLFGLLQLLALGFFIGSAIMLFQHILGYRNLKITVGAALISMVMSSVMMAAPGVANYISDLRGPTSVIDST
jgi:hypothetical protein